MQMTNSSSVCADFVLGGMTINNDVCCMKAFVSC